MGVLPILYWAKRSSSTMTSGSGYRTRLLTPQSRSAAADFGARAAPAAAIAAVARKCRRSMKVFSVAEDWEESAARNMVFMAEGVWIRAKLAVSRNTGQV